MFTRLFFHEYVFLPNLEFGWRFQYMGRIPPFSPFGRPGDDNNNNSCWEYFNFLGFDTEYKNKKLKIEYVSCLASTIKTMPASTDLKWE